MRLLHRCWLFSLALGPVEAVAAHGESSFMTFLVNQQGRVSQRDLGAKTGELAPALNTCDPDPNWALSPD